MRTGTTLYAHREVDLRYIAHAFGLPWTGDREHNMRMLADRFAGEDLGTGEQQRRVHHRLLALGFAGEQLPDAQPVGRIVGFADGTVDSVLNLITLITKISGDFPHRHINLLLSGVVLEGAGAALQLLSRGLLDDPWVKERLARAEKFRRGGLTEFDCGVAMLFGFLEADGIRIDVTMMSSVGRDIRGIRLELRDGRCIFVHNQTADRPDNTTAFHDTARVCEAIRMDGDLFALGSQTLCIMPPFGAEARFAALQATLNALQRQPVLHLATPPIHNDDPRFVPWALGELGRLMRQ